MLSLENLRECLLGDERETVTDILYYEDDFYVVVYSVDVAIFHVSLRRDIACFPWLSSGVRSQICCSDISSNKTTAIPEKVLAFANLYGYL